MRAPELLQRADLLKSNVIGENGDVEWQTRFELQQLLENALIADLDYAIDRQVEQTLWNFCFKNCIDAYQQKLRRRKMDADVARLQLFLDSCIGYFMQLLGRLCREYELRLDCYESDAGLGILNGHFRSKKTAETATLHHVAQFCLIHLGDVARYQKNTEDAENFYIRAWQIDPDNGHALNQLAILETSAGRHLSALALYTRSLYVRNPFQLASGNIEKFCDTIDAGGDPGTYLSSFFRLFSAVHNCRRLDEAAKLSKNFLQSTRDACERDEIYNSDLENLLIVIIGEIWKIASISGDISEIFTAAASFCSNKPNPDAAAAVLSSDEIRCLRILLDCLRAITTTSIFSAVKKIDKIDSYLAVVKLALDFSTLHPEIFTICCSRHENSVLLFLSALSSLLNQLQAVDIYGDKNLISLTDDSPLPEDVRLRGFLPLENVHASLDFDKKTSDDADNFTKTRIWRLVSAGRIIAQRLDDAEIFAAISLEKSENDAGERWTFSAKAVNERADTSPSPVASPVQAAENQAPQSKRGNSVVKRQTKVLPLIKILEKEKSAPETKPAAVDSPKPAATKGVLIKTPEPVADTPSPTPFSVGTTPGTDRRDSAPRFQAARLKQALTGEATTRQQCPVEMIPPSWSGNQQQAPIAAWFQRPPPPRSAHPPPMMLPPRPVVGPNDSAGFHRTPGVRPLGPPPFPPPPSMFGGPPSGFRPMPAPHPWPVAGPTWDQRQQGPSLFFGRNEDAYGRSWDTQRQRPLSAIGEPWRTSEWSRADGVRDARASSNSPFFDSSSRFNEMPGVGDAVFQHGSRTVEDRRSQPEAPFSLFGIDSPWEYASERLQSQGEKDA